MSARATRGDSHKGLWRRLRRAPPPVEVRGGLPVPPVVLWIAMLALLSAFAVASALRRRRHAQKGTMNSTPAPKNDPTPNEPDAPPLHVIPDRVGGWRVEREGAERPLSQHDSETEAEDAAVRAARDTKTSEVVIHDCYDRIREAKP